MSGMVLKSDARTSGVNLSVGLLIVVVLVEDGVG